MILNARRLPKPHVELPPWKTAAVTQELEEQDDIRADNDHQGE